MIHHLEEVYPYELPGSFEHGLSRECWCKPVLLGSVLVHRPWVEVAPEIAKANLAKSFEA
jgi:hypothetical protein